MAISENIAKFISRIFCTVKSEAAEWKKANQPELDKLMNDREIAKAELKHSLERMDIRFKEECNRIRLEEERQTVHFQEFLESIDEMKTSMLENYSGMPRPIALMIHHHASELLKEAWFSQDTRDRLKSQTQFTDLMLTITEDLAALDPETQAKALPQKTLALIQNKNSAQG